MCEGRKKIQKYKSDIQEFNQKHWDEPIQIEELIFSNYDDDNKAGSKKNEIVFIDINYDLDWITSYEVANENLLLVNNMMILTSLPYKHFSKKKQIAFLKIIGQGVVAALDGGKDDVAKCQEQASLFHRQVSYAIGRWKNLLAALLAFVVGLVFFRCTYENDWFHTCALWGFIGAFLSVCYRNEKRYSYVEQNFWSLLLNTLVKECMGIIFGIVSYYLANNMFVKTGALALENYTIIALIAGFSEKLVPSFIDKYENKLFKGRGE